MEIVIIHDRIHFQTHNSIFYHKTCLMLNYAEILM